jgi:hypothetical protein
VNNNWRPYWANRARSIAAQLEVWKGDRDTSGEDREAILAVTTGRTEESQKDQAGTEEIYQVGFYWDGRIIVRNGQDHEYQPPAKLKSLLHDWCAEHCKARNFGYPAQEGFIIKMRVSLSCDGAYPA